MDQARQQLIRVTADSAMEELIALACIGAPLWIADSFGSNTYVINEEEYHRTFPQAIWPELIGFKCESSRETAVVMISPPKLVEILMDKFRWAAVFAGIVARAITHEVLTPGVAGNYDGALQVLSAEFQAPSHLVPTREAYFARYCRRHDNGCWAVVDVSLDSLCPSISVSCRRRPSGCLIHGMPNGYSKITWVEHVDADDRGVHNMYRAFVNSGLAFGAKCWISILDRQCERLASVMAPSLPNTDAKTIEGRKSMLNLAERIGTTFCGGMSESNGHSWRTILGRGDDEVRIMIGKMLADLGTPLGVVLNAAISFSLPVHPKRVFDFLRSQDSRSQWDILSHGGELQEIAFVANGRETGNRLSLFRIITADGTNRYVLILQETWIGPTGCFVVYAPVDVVMMNAVLDGVDSTLAEILPSGFAIVPDGPKEIAGRNAETGESNCGSLVTAQFQILVDCDPTARIHIDSIAAIKTLVIGTVNRIKDAMGASSTGRAASSNTPPHM
ncbi:homeobox-leucine zipper protein ROC2-like [Diospyros lotus]|uniref:homeobox-leucine zipper protein ROC2-like n=1 Tax=Diospyros lotus TaxID=55363 RepID=UPI00225140CA|nr:homeobox-leucine zipper protein ROC2-like [Diospyros lotus]XP_052179198.1 homeobox-leucine zipper protein ROC2-like [Diospyros lotus]XP_052179199.1 homeobox-leucine zipper protein ROC2-like [Diospyros lotus]XP_052179201.1 homeobox-leucine zipper protein ROC2-like [Diospyros lotus]XP_052179202.1 homeobox-leucine zipper protein ROC2-like [Diospyros lotus]XP_052179203.1 homeobox-leucine zipper protein ROC2-like [Diospyros lotus]XP_052179204.1 homeobox-leucine zipper protein ROC2-like [Diospyr